MATANSSHDIDGVGSSLQSLPLHQLHRSSVSMAPSGTPQFKSYVAYLESIVEDWPAHKSLIQYLKSTSERNYRSGIVVAEVHGNEISCQSFESPYDTDTVLASVLSASEQKSTSIQTQIIFVQSFVGQGVQKLVDAIGLLYDVDPEFFQMMHQSNENTHYSMFMRANSEMMKNFGYGSWIDVEQVLRPPPTRRFLSISGSLACQVLQGRNTAGHEYAVVLGFMNKLDQRDRRDQTPQTRQTYLYGPLDNNRPSAHDSPRPSSGAQRTGKGCYMLPMALADHLKTWNASDIAAANTNSYLYMYPLLQMTAQDLSINILGIRSAHERFFGQWVEDEVDSQKVGVMRVAAAFSSKLDRYTDFVRDFGGLPKIHPEAQGPKYDEVLACWKNALDDGRRVVQMVQANMQSEMSFLSIQASQRSIEEAVSVKRLTQLAFVFIPLSFVTSLFGMNVKEISGDGVRLWVFLVTAISVTFLIFLMWRLSVLLQDRWNFLLIRLSFKWSELWQSRGHDREI